MELLKTLFGEGRDLNTLQMCNRAVLIFMWALILIRISGRRSFGLHSPLDNIITILLGAILSRAVAGVSPMLPVAASCLAIVLLHRLMGMVLARNQHFGRFLQGKRILLFEHGHFISENLKRALVSKDDVMQGIRRAALTENLDQLDKVYMERNGEISAIKKESE